MAEKGGRDHESVEKGIADDKTKKEKQERAVVRQEKKKRKLEELQESQAQFDMCVKGCKCNLEIPCKMVGMIQCEVCRDIKKKKCGKRDCIEKMKANCNIPVEPPPSKTVPKK
jgi:hypothetical protein